MAWVVSVVLDGDKTDVGTINARFTDTDGRVFTYSARIQATAELAQIEVDKAIAEKDAWLTHKTTEIADADFVVGLFTAAGETATREGA